MLNPQALIDQLAADAHHALREYDQAHVSGEAGVALTSYRLQGARTALGRPPAMDAEMIARARRLFTQPEETVSSIAKLLGVSRATLYKYVPELSPARGRRELEAGVQNREESR